MIVSSQFFEAYLECPTKCWLRSRQEPSAGNAYAEWARAQNKAYFEGAVKRFLVGLPESDRTPTISKHSKNATWRFAIGVRLQTNNLESCLQAVERIPSGGRGRPVQFVLHRFVFRNKLTKNDRLLLAFDALVLSEVVGYDVSLGKITHGDRYDTLKVKLSTLAGEVQKRVKKIAALLLDNSPPDLVLNPHCGQCEFQARCRKQATEKNELSLLSRMRETERKKLHDKGIFTVTQLSYTFRPRRRCAELRARRERFHHSLRALAIRENKTHAVDLLGGKTRRHSRLPGCRRSS
jgi:predicted RecB family nuclease